MKVSAQRLENRRNQLLEAATIVFARKGFHDTRIADIAREAGVAYGLVYHYFKNKDEILGSLFEGNWGLFLQSIDYIRENKQGVSVVDGYKTPKNFFELKNLGIF